MSENKSNLKQIDGTNSKKQAMREKLMSMQQKLRKIEIECEQAQIENMNLVNVEKQEAELRATRDANETLLLGVASNSQNESMKWTSQKIEEIIDQDKLVLSKQEFLTKKMNLRQSLNVTKLVNMIETDMKANQDEINSKIPSFLQEYEQKHAHYV